MLKIKAILIGLNFFIRTGNRGFHSPYIDLIMLSNIESKTKIYAYMITEDRSIINTMNVYTLEFVKKKRDTKLGGTHKHNVLSVYC